MKILFLTALMFFLVKTSSAQTGDSSINKFINTWNKTRYKVGGTTLKGVDCSGLTRILYSTVYDKKIPKIAREQYRISTRVEKDSLILGDLVFFRTSTRSGWHVGVYLSDGNFFHSGSSKTGVHISSLNNAFYKKAYLGAGRFPDYPGDTVFRNPTTANNE